MDDAREVRSSSIFVYFPQLPTGSEAQRQKTKQQKRQMSFPAAVIFVLKPSIQCDQIFSPEISVENKHNCAADSLQKEAKQNTKVKKWLTFPFLPIAKILWYFTPLHQKTDHFIASRDCIKPHKKPFDCDQLVKWVRKQQNFH